MLLYALVERLFFRIFIDMHNSLAIHYNSGTGGNYALWLVLLATDYKCHFKNFSCDTLEDLNNLYNFVWDKKHRNHWAGQEPEIDVERTINDNSIDKKVFLFGDNDQNQDFRSFNQNIVIYTDIFLQSMLSIEKQTACGILTNINIADKKLHHNAAKYLSMLLPTVEYSNQKIASYYKNVIDINKADAVFDLKDLVKSSGNPLINYLGYRQNQIAKDFTKKYVALHSQQCREFFN